MKIEHLGLNVKDPLALTDWYVKNLGMKVMREGPAPANARFLADESGKMMLEVYCNTAAPIPDYAATDLLVLHLALLADDVNATCQRLLKAGATSLVAPFTADNGDCIAAVRDPWGIALQIVKRSKPMM